MAFNPNTTIAHTGSGSMRPKVKYYDREKAKWTSKEGAESSQAHGNGENSGDNGETDKSQGNRFSLPYGLCAGLGIDTTGMTPREAWDAYMNATGKSKEQAESEHWGKEKKSGQTAEIVDKDKKKIHNIEKVNSFDDYSNFLADKYSVKVDDSVKNLDFRTVKEATKGIDFIFDEFPQAKSVFQFVNTKNSGVMCATFRGAINFNPKYFVKDNATAETSMKSGNETGFHPKNNNLASTGAHEAGHLLELALIKKSLKEEGKPEVYGTLDWMSGTKAKAVIRTACERAKKETKKNFTVLKREVSVYATEKDSECLAECVADYAANKENASILSKEVWKILKEKLG